MSLATLSPPALAAAVATVSCDGAFWYTRRNLMYELVRAAAWPDPGSDPDQAHTRFQAVLDDHEAEHGPLAKLIRPEHASPGLAPDDLAAFDMPDDLFDYAVRRVVVLDRIETCLLLITNGFHRKIEVAPVAYPGFPSHVWDRVHAQLDAGISTTFFAVHDCSAAGYAWLHELRGALRERELASKKAKAKVVHVGLSVPWAFRLRLPLRSTGRPLDPALPSGPGRDFLPLLRAGSYAELEELRPLDALGWIYSRTARGAEDVGFG